MSKFHPPFVMVLFSTIITCILFLKLTNYIFNDDLASLPVLIWWTPAIYPSNSDDVITCDNRKCLITNSRNYLNIYDSNRPVMLLFYGSDFDENDIPLHESSRNQLWALLHEESPMNNYIFSHSEFIQLFNYTSTFRRESDLPLTTLHLPNLEYLTARKPLPVISKNRLRRELAPVVYVQSNCDVPSDRDSYVSQLSKYIPIDSYGACLHNKDLPSNIDTHEKFNDEEFLSLISKYKFYLAYENALCDDYMTEKLFRSFHVGVVPIYKGSSRVLDWIPTPKSVILIDDFSSAKELAEHLLKLDSNDTLYEESLIFKLPEVGITNKYLVQHLHNRKWGINFVESFQCYLCDQLTEIQNHQVIKTANSSHFGCPLPSMPIHNNNNNNKISYWIQKYSKSMDTANKIKIKLLTKQSNDNLNMAKDQL
ncbi:hypothetical protein CHUAL_002662 [Chamberlinius hualienensis]